MPGRGLIPVALLIAIGVMLAGCGGMAPQFSQGLGPRTPHPTYKIGGPYTVKGITYYPHVDYAYDQTGLASWYGEAFDGQYTANGEVFDLNQITAAHKTLPLPSIVEIVNLQNNRALRVRVNDRGPFVEGRVIDVSRRVAQLLGFERSGTAMVRVRILKDESLQAEAAAAQGLISNGSAFAAAVPTPLPPPLPLAAPRPASAPAPVTLAAAAPPEKQIGAPATVYQEPPQPQAAQPVHHFLVQSPLYRMEIGPVDTQDEANRALAQMIQSGYRDAHIVMN
ncbi:MAG TPA: septal ring lytic transglycosylase RlpA family protein [Stellaceae bacterium]|nr:septal ring lytic transglycosylase RlpA family protein [Stellaceae bacterium]